MGFPYRTSKRAIQSYCGTDWHSIDIVYNNNNNVSFETVAATPGAGRSSFTGPMVITRVLRSLHENTSTV